MSNLSDIEARIISAATALDPTSPVVKIIEMILVTAKDPNAVNIIADVELIIGLIKQYLASKT